jgi:hypothetical protein
MGQAVPRDTIQAASTDMAATPSTERQRQKLGGPELRSRDSQLGSGFCLGTIAFVGA